MSNLKRRFICSVCGNTTTIKGMKKCSNCGSFDSYEEECESINLDSCENKALKLKDIESLAESRFYTGLLEFDRVYGGGIVTDSINIVAAAPGAGKTTLMMKVAAIYAKAGKTTIYASGEESAKQLDNKAKRLLTDIPENLYIMNSNIIEEVISEVERLKADMFVIDSSKVFKSKGVEGRSGTPTQMISVIEEIRKICKYNNRPVTCFIIGQVTKDEDLAGTKEFEHAGDSLIYIDAEEDIRFLRPTKNRFGELQTGFFVMSDKGMDSIDNPAEYFISKREKGDWVPGVCLSLIQEGTRPIIVEIEALVTKSYMPYPSRIATCLKKDSLNILLSIITQSLKINMEDYSVVVNTTGGLKLQKKSTDLAIIMCILSTLDNNEAIPSDYVFLAEVGLTGELKKVNSIESKIAELQRMGYKKVFTSKNNLINKKRFKEIDIVECKNISEVYNKVFKGKTKNERI